MWYENTSRTPLKDTEKFIKEANAQMEPNPTPAVSENNPFQRYPDFRMFWIGDFANESMKTYKNRKWWKLMVGSAEASVEMIPDDIVIKELQWDTPVWSSGAVKYCTTNGNQFDFSVNTWSPYTIESTWKVPTSPSAPNKIAILKTWVYEIEFAYGITSATWLSAIRFAIEKNGNAIIQDKQERPLVLADYNDPTKTFVYPITTLSWYRKKYVSLTKWDLIELIVSANCPVSGSFTLEKDYTYRSLHYFKSNR